MPPHRSHRARTAPLSAFDQEFAHEILRIERKRVTILAMVMVGGVFLGMRSCGVVGGKLVATLDDVDPASGGSAIFVSLTIKNRGYATSLTDWSLYIWSPKLELPDVPVAPLPPDDRPLTADL